MSRHALVAALATAEAEYDTAHVLLEAARSGVDAADDKLRAASRALGDWDRARATGYDDDGAADAYRQLEAMS